MKKTSYLYDRNIINMKKIISSMKCEKDEWKISSAKSTYQKYKEKVEELNLFIKNHCEININLSDEEKEKNLYKINSMKHYLVVLGIRFQLIINNAIPPYPIYSKDQ